MELQQPDRKVLLRDGKNFLLGAFLCILYLFLIQKIFGAVCWVRLAFGFPCPLCGLTRAAGLFLQGDFVGAWQMHAMFYFVLFFLPVYIFCKYFVKNGSKMIKGYGIIFMFAAIVYYIYRMLYLFPEQEPLIYYQDNWSEYIRFLVLMRNR